MNTEDWMDSAGAMDRINLAVELLSCERLMAEVCRRMAYELIAYQREPMAGDSVRVEFRLTRDQAADALAAIRRAMSRTALADVKPEISPAAQLTAKG